MSFSVASTNAIAVKTGSCPHGLPHGACPICSGMGGGGGSVKREDSKPKANEMSYDECFAVWMQMKAEKQAKADKEAAFQAQANAALIQNKMQIMAFAQKMANAAEKITNFAQKISQNHPILSKPLVFIAKNIAAPIINTVKNVVVAVVNVAKFIGQKFADISDKLAAVWGEFKNSTLKKASDKFNNFRKKLSSFFIISTPKKTDDEENKLESEKRIFDIKTLFQKVQKSLTNKKEKEYGRD